MIQQFDDVGQLRKPVRHAEQTDLTSIWSGVQDFQDPLDYKLARIKKNSLKILYGIDQAHPQSIQSAQLALIANIHRSTVSVHLLELEELELIQKDVLAGTENKVKPTYCYKLHPSVSRDRLQAAYKKQFPLEKLPLDSEHKVDPREPDKRFQRQESQDSNNTENQSFEKAIGLLVTQMTHEIVALRDRVTELERKLDEKSRQESAELAQAMDLLNSLRTKSRK